MIVTPAELLTSAEVERVHEASLQILEDVGLLVHNEKAREIFGRHGCHVDAETQVKFPRAVVERFRAAFPHLYLPRARSPI